jgi:hypothetical protein
MRPRSKPSSAFWRRTRRVEGLDVVGAALHALVGPQGMEGDRQMQQLRR